MDASTLAAPNRNYLESLQASSDLVCANEMSGLFLPPHFSLLEPLNALFCTSTLARHLRVIPTALHTAHAAFDTDLFQAFKHFPPVNSYLPSLDGTKSLSELISLWWTCLTV